MICPYCQKKARWCDNAERYGRRYGTSYMCYWCKDCDAYVGCRNNTKQPLGTMADKELRELRMTAHGLFDPMWKGGGMSRTEAYNFLKNNFGREIHMGESDVKTCREIINFLQSLNNKTQIT